jgi:putative sterol carrier protein
MRKLRSTIWAKCKPIREVLLQLFFHKLLSLQKEFAMNTRELLYALPSKVSPSAVEGLETVFHFDIEGNRGGQYTISVAKGNVRVEDGLVGEPKCVIRSSDENFINLVTGELNPMMAVLTGKVKISNQSEMLKYAKIFGLM